jgi:protein ImuB
MRLVEGSDEARFLGPLPVSLLPLPHLHLQQLHWLGIRTLGQFAALPPAGVWQRFGAAGKQAQRWAQGRDDRPVAPAMAAPPEPATVTLDPPTGALQPVVEAIMESLRPVLAERAARLEGIRRLRLEVHFAAAEAQGTELTFVEPASQPPRVQAALVQQLYRLHWPGEVEIVRWALLESGELVAPQLALFADPPKRLAALEDLAQQLSSRYGASLFRAAVSQSNHPVPERRSALLPLREHVAPVA